MNLKPPVSLAAASLLALALSACSAAGDGAAEAAPTAPSAGPSATASPALSSPVAPPNAGGTAAYDERLSRIEAAIRQWQSAPDLKTAHRAAETARNLVVGPDGPWYGDADRDGTVAGASAHGLLPGGRGQPGIAAAGLNPCIDRDVRGGDWSNPGERWAILDRAIRVWSPTNNPFPRLPSHPQRIVGWATLALASDDLAKAREFAGHARIHSDVSRQALESCG